MDSAVTKFLYIGTPEDMVKSANLVTVSFPSWNDTQSNAMKLTLAKGRSTGGRVSGAQLKAQANMAAIDQEIADITKPSQGIRPPGTSAPRAERTTPSEPRAKR
jgi:hypothetical protein